MSIEQKAIEARVADGFKRANFIVDLGIEATACGAGWVEAEMPILPRHLQQGGFVHAGVQSTLADHTAGAAAATLLDEGFSLLTIEFKVNLLRPALCDTLQCRAEVLKPGKQVCVVESEVFAINNGEKRLFSKTMVTLAVLPVAATLPR
ncbi:PaaI family thioesterase [Halopseudomonas sp.]|uniref:PaaI family thioesterase n=1 Tax=Halopseudomonas sp. TaxID=2901191 RepID=UPI003002F751